MNSKFIEASNRFDGELNITDLKVSGMIGSKIPVTIYTLTLYHKNTCIRIIYEFGNSNTAEVKFHIHNSQQIPNFKLITRDHFSKLFSTNKNPWKTICKNKNFGAKIVDILNASGLTEIANKTSFEPILNGNYKNDMYEFSIIFYLGFDEKENSLIPVIEFNKSFIDYITKNYCR